MLKIVVAVARDGYGFRFMHILRNVRSLVGCRSPCAVKGSFAIAYRTLFVVMDVRRSENNELDTRFFCAVKQVTKYLYLCLQATFA